MHSPRVFSVKDEALLTAFISRYSFCTLITPAKNGLHISHVPLLVEQHGQRLRLSGHLARVNPHIDAMDGKPCTAVFNGPHSYISPAWYEDSGEVPTWNYAVVHAEGHARTTNDHAVLSTMVDQLIETYETKHGAPWDRRLETDYRSRQLNHISGFYIDIDSLHGKFKLGQNRSQEDQDKMLKHLISSDDEDARLLGRFIQHYREHS